jgi:hypothetical protein
MSGVLVTAVSANRKTGACATTAVSQESCPLDCPFRGNGCYAEYGPQGIITRRLNASLDPVVALALEEARRIDALPADRPLRVHVVGDCATAESATLVGAAMVRYATRGQTFAWTYTHAWRAVPLAAWQGASVLASCESVADIEAAEARGYATALVVSEHPGRKVYTRGTRQILPCPNEFGGPQCLDCGLCAKPTMLRARKLTIGFAAHGSGARKVKETVR